MGWSKQAKYWTFARDQQWNETQSCWPPDNSFNPSSTKAPEQLGQLKEFWLQPGKVLKK